MTEQQEKRLMEFVHDLLSAAHCAHEIIEGAVEGKPLRANRLENYYDGIMTAMRRTALSGGLIGPALESMNEIVEDKSLVEHLTDTETDNVSGA